MAKIVLGLAASHTPQISSSPEGWQGHGSRDEGDPMLVGNDGEFHAYGDLLAAAGSDLAHEVTPEVWAEKFARAQDGVAVLQERLAAANPDVVVVIGDDQREMFKDDGTPAIGLCIGDSVVDMGITDMMRKFVPPDIQPALWAAHSEEPESYPIATEMAGHLALALTEADFDVTVMSRQPDDRGLGHAFTFVRRRLGLPEPTPMVPFMMNTYYPPNVLSPQRCYALGQALKAAIEAAPGSERVAIVASGGLSHCYVLEDLDRKVLDALVKHDAATLGSIPRRYFRSGTSEILNWIVAGGALEDYEMEVVDYIAGYRSPAGTGTGIGFASWEPAAA